ncbi:MAG TPA: hypothetical protein VGF59_06845 [Bryobacteraceae bacterium]
MRYFLVLFAAAVAVAQQPRQWPPPGMRCPQRTLVLFEQGANGAKAGQFFDEHIAYLLAQMKSGKILSAGPASSGPAAAVFTSTDWPEVEEILKNEPFTREGVMKVSSHAVWNACEAAN